MYHDKNNKETRQNIEHIKHINEVFNSTSIDVMYMSIPS